MNQHIYLRSGLLLVFLSMFLSFTACRHDQVIENITEDNTDMKISAHQYYDNALVELRSLNIEGKSTEAHFTALDFTPDWNKAILHKKNGNTILEVPVKFANESMLAASSSGSPTRFNANSDILMPSRLIISKSEKGTFDAHLMVIQSESPYVEGIVPEFDLFNKIENFTGLEWLYNLDGSFSKGWKHENGKIVGKIVFKQNNVVQQQSGKLQCWYLVLTYNGNIISVLGLLYCDGQVVLDGGGGYDWGSNNGGGGDPPDPCDSANPPSYCNTNKCKCSNQNKYSNDFTTISFTADFYVTIINLCSVSMSQAISDVVCNPGSYTSTLTSRNTITYAGSVTRENEYTYVISKQKVNPKDANCGVNLSLMNGGQITYTGTSGVFEGVSYPSNWSRITNYTLN